MSTTGRDRWSRLLFSALLSALTIGVFITGRHLGAQRHHGRNLLQNQSLSTQRAAGPITLATVHRVRVAANTPNPNGDAGTPDVSGDDVTVDSPGGTFQQVYYLLKRNFVDGVPTDAIMGHGAAAAMLSSLQDPNSRFLERADMAEITREAHGTYNGLGAALAIRSLLHGTPIKNPLLSQAAAAPAVRNAHQKQVKDGKAPRSASDENLQYSEYRVTVVAPLPGSPAEKAGLKPGDVITNINGQWIATYDPLLAQMKALKAAQDDPVEFNKIVSAVQKRIDTGLSVSQAETMLSTASAKPLTLTVSRPGVLQPLTLMVDVSAPTTVAAVDSKLLPEQIGYIKITQLDDDAAKQFETDLTKLGDLHGLVLDLRDTPGGLLDATTILASKLTATPALGILQGKGKHETQIALKPAKAVACPIVVLVNSGTANTAELLASALQAGGAKLVGATTFGDATDVQPVVLRDGSGFTMTVGKFFTAKHSDFADKGISPDIAVPASDTTDAPLARAVGLLTGRVARLP